MKKTIPIYLVIAVTMTLASCVQHDEPTIKQDEVNTLQELYENLTQIPTTSMLDMAINVNDNSRKIESGLPVLTPEDINYLASISQEEFGEIRDILNLQTGESSYTENRQDSKFDKLYYDLGEIDGYKQFISFSEQYITSNEGWSNIEMILPSNLNETQNLIYICQAIYIDKIARPVYNALGKKGNNERAQSRGISYCKDLLQSDLIAAGSELTADQFIALMSGGTLEFLDAVDFIIDAFGIWYDYEACNGRFH